VRQHVVDDAHAEDGEPAEEREVGVPLPWLPPNCVGLML
jgi:hypothetical protein